MRKLITVTKTKCDNVNNTSSIRKFANLLEFHCVFIDYIYT